MESGTTLNDAQKTISEMEKVVRRNSGTQDAFIGVQLKEGHEISTFEYASNLRKLLHLL